MGFRLELAPQQTFFLREGVSLRNGGNDRIIIIVESVDPDAEDSV